MERVTGTCVIAGAAHDTFTAYEDSVISSALHGCSIQTKADWSVDWEERLLIDVTKNRGKSFPHQARIVERRIHRAGFCPGVESVTFCGRMVQLV